MTTEPMLRNRNVLWWAVEAYLTRWKVEDTIRFIKQNYDFEDIRYYALADGIRAIFKRVGKGPLHPGGYKPVPSAQLSLY